MCALGDGKPAWPPAVGRSLLLPLLRVVVGAVWEAYCHAHLVELPSNRCGTVTYCHTLVRPGYCPFCMGKTELPASQRLKPWSRDHKLWVHIEEEHLVGCQWPLTCLHPSCDTLHTDWTAFRFHLMDGHEISRVRPGKPATPGHTPLPDKVPRDEEADGARARRKRTSRKPSGVREWVPSQSRGESPILPAEVLHHLPKRQKQANSTLSPQIISIDADTSDNQVTHTTMDSIKLSPLSTSRGDDHKSADADYDILFDQYIRSPSPFQPLSPEDTDSQFSGVTLVETKRDQRIGYTEQTPDRLQRFTPEDGQRSEIAPDRADCRDAASGPRIRLQVSHPKISTTASAILVIEP